MIIEPSSHADVYLLSSGKKVLNKIKSAVTRLINLLYCEKKLFAMKSQMFILTGQLINIKFST